MAKPKCSTCRYYRAPAPVELFSEEDRRNPEVEKVAHEVYEWERQRQLYEGQRIANRHLLEHEPKHYGWCEGYTREINRYFTLQDARNFHGELLRGKAQGAREYLNKAIGRGQALKAAAAAGDSQAAQQLEEIRRNMTDHGNTYFMPALYVNDDGECDQWIGIKDRREDGAER